jgi:ABC-2 type transport system ATP-binding protein
MNAVLQVSGLTRGYRRSLGQLVDKETRQLRSGIFNVSFSVARGEVYGLLGMEGAGKTTLIRSVLGFVRPSSGKVIFQGKRVLWGLNTFVRNAGYLPQEYNFYEDMSGEQFLKFMSSGRQVDPAYRKKLLTALKLDRDTLKSRVWEYAPVLQQKLVLAAAMQHKPPFLALDEPTHQMNMPEQQAIYRLLDSYTAGGGTVLLATTSAAEAETICSRIALLHQGRIIAEETPESLNRKAIYNFAVHMEPVPGENFYTETGATPPRPGGRSLHFQAAGDISRILSELHKAGRIQSLELERAPLEDSLARFYKKEELHA